jgi:hypothetical protein
VAIAHDPFLATDVAPDVLGGRPLGFSQPAPEAERARLFNPPRRPLQPVPLLEPIAVGLPVAPPASNPWAAAPPPAIYSVPPVTAPPQPYPSVPPASPASPFQQQIRSPY